MQALQAYTLANYATIYSKYNYYQSDMKRCYQMTAEGADIREAIYLYSSKTPGQIYKLFCDAESIEDWYILLDVLIMYITRKDYPASQILTKVIATLARHERIARLLKNQDTLDAIADFWKHLCTLELLVPEIELYFMLLNKQALDLGHTVSTNQFVQLIKVNNQSKEVETYLKFSWPSHGFLRFFLVQNSVYTETVALQPRGITLCFFYDAEQKNYFYNLFRSTLKRVTGNKRTL